jgi:NADH-quinone oxidoreductase subunit H
MTEALLIGALASFGGYASAVFDRWWFMWHGARPPRLKRLGAALVGPFDDALRELRRPVRRLTKPDGALWWSAPAIALASVLLAWAVIPIGPGIIASDLTLGLFFFIVVLGPFMVALMDAGWGTNGPFGVVTAFRAAAHIIAYEVAFGFAMLGPAMMAESLSAVRIVEAQEHVWFIVLQPGSFLIYVASALILAYRFPFDLPFAGAELAGGAMSEYSGPQRAILAGARHALVGALAAVGAVSFLGGWLGPFLPPILWTGLKTLGLIALFGAAPHVLPRLRLDQMLTFAWKGLLPFALANIVIVGIVAAVAGQLGWIR